MPQPPSCTSGLHSPADNGTDGNGLGSVCGEDEIFAKSSRPRNNFLPARSVGERTARNPIGRDAISPFDSEDEPPAEALTPEDGAIGGNIFLNEGIGFNLQLDAGSGYGLSVFKAGSWGVVQGCWNRCRDGD